MANKSLFASLKSRFVRADTRNEAGGRAYTLSRSTPWPSWLPPAASTAPTTPRPTSNSPR